MQPNSCGSGQKGLAAPRGMRRNAREKQWPLFGATRTQVTAVVDGVSLAYLEDVAVLDLVLQRVIVCHDSTHDGIPVKRQHFVISWRMSFLRHARPSLN